MRTLLQVLREDLNCTSVKEGCNEGDCGACTMVLGEAIDGRIQYRAVNSCIRMAHSVDGMVVWVAEDIVANDGSLHPVQQAMVYVAVDLICLTLACRLTTFDTLRVLVPA